MNLEKIVANLVQKVEHRFYGKYRGFVVDNADPEKLGRLKVKNLENSLVEFAYKG